MPDPLHTITFTLTRADALAYERLASRPTLRAIILFLLAAVLYLLFATRYYTGSAKLFVQQSGPNVLGEVQRNAQDNQAFLFTQREMMSSTPVVAMALGTPGIRELKTFDGLENTFAYFKDHLSVEVGKRDDRRYRHHRRPGFEHRRRLDLGYRKSA